MVSNSLTNLLSRSRIKYFGFPGSFSKLRVIDSGNCAGRDTHSDSKYVLVLNAFDKLRGELLSRLSALA